MLGDGGLLEPDEPANALVSVPMSHRCYCRDQKFSPNFEPVLAPFISEVEFTQAIEVLNAEYQPVAKLACRIASIVYGSLIPGFIIFLPGTS